MIEFDDNNAVRTENGCRAILAGVSFNGADVSDSMKELKGLAEAADAEILGIMVQPRERPDKATYIGTGKTDELAEMCLNMGADTVIFNNELSGIQLRNLEDRLGVTVLDRTILILDIFAARAVSSAGRLQVELAQLRYRLPRLQGFGRSLSRTGGGIGARGPGEKKLETDRRHIQSRMDEIKREIKEAERSGNVRRSRREKSEIPVVALVGYTNAGKSATMNMLLSMNNREDKAVFEKDMLFATLDVAHRNIKLDTGQEFILTDTVGFVSKLPHTLVEAFKSTLEETLYADLLLNIVDVSKDDRNFKESVTMQVLREIGAGEIPCVTVYNKTDLVENTSEIEEISLTADRDAVFISAKKRLNADGLLDIIKDRLFSSERIAELLVPYDRGSVTSYLCDKCRVENMEYRENGTYFRVMLGPADHSRLKEFFVNEQL